MKIVILVRILWSAGAQRIAIKEAETLQKMGHDVTLVFLRYSKTGEVYLPLLKNINYKILTYKSKPSIFSGIYDYITGLFAPDRRGEGRLDYDLLKKFPKYVKPFKPDKIICHDEWAGIAGFLTKKKYGISYEVFLHERLGELKVPILGKFLENYREKILKNATKIYAVTEKIASDTKIRFHFNVIANPPGFDQAEVIQPSQRENMVVSASMWDKGRNPFYFIELEKYLKDYKIALIGNWRDETYFELFKKNISKNSHILLLKGISEIEKTSLIGKSKFLVRFGYMEYGPAIAVIDSISAGTPVIINSDLGTAEMVKQFEAGYVLDNIDPKNVAKIIKDTNFLEYERLVNNVIKLRNTISWKAHCEKLL